MPHLVRWHEELGDFGLVVIGAHVQKAPDDAIKRKVELLGIRFPVTKGGRFEEDDERGIPRCFLFDHTGEIAFKGHPKDAESKLRIAVGTALVEAAGLKYPNSTIRPFVEDLKQGKPPLPILQKLLPVSRGSDEGAKQAKALVEKMLESGQARFNEAKADMKDDPVAAYDTALRLMQSFKSTPLAQQATELTYKLRSDKKVFAELKARSLLESVKKLDTALMAAAKDKDPKSAEFKKTFATPIKQMTTVLNNLNRNYPEARATKEALEIGEKYDIALSR